MLNLDHAATTPMLPVAVATYVETATRILGNPSSPHALGTEARGMVEEARLRVAAHLGAGPEGLHFTSGGTESNNLAVLGIARAAARAGKGRHVVTSAIEHPSVLEAVRQLEREGFEATCLRVDGAGRIAPGELAVALRAGTVLVSIQQANPEIGTVQPIAELAAIARAHGIPFHTDAVQSLGKIGVSVGALGVDALSVSAHKAYGPRGVGALWIRPGTSIEPLLHGGGQEARVRPGTEDVAGAVAFAAALDEVIPVVATGERRWRGLQERFEGELKARVPGVRILAEQAARVPGLVGVCIKGVSGKALVQELASRGIAVGSGSACGAHLAGPSHVVAALGIEAPLAAGQIRVSFGLETAEQELSRAVAAIGAAAARLRALPPCDRPSCGS
ncbi:MAG: cysteine desulfurase [Planctomycetes bacterium]|nr:cysteine desulfurase [Planctomycetota bacterium]